MFRAHLEDMKRATPAEMDALEADIAKEVEDCATFAMESPLPELSVAFDDLYSDHYELEDVL